MSHPSAILASPAASHRSASSTAGGDDSRVAGLWLAAFAMMVFIMILVGGATRLTESGLSITEWKPVSGIIPPLTDAQWESEFAKYRRIPQYQQLNAGMSLDGFRGIYLWECTVIGSRRVSWGWRSSCRSHGLRSADGCPRSRSGARGCCW